MSSAAASGALGPEHLYSAGEGQPPRSFSQARASRSFNVAPLATSEAALGSSSSRPPSSSLASSPSSVAHPSHVELNRIGSAGNGTGKVHTVHVGARPSMSHSTRQTQPIAPGTAVTTAVHPTTTQASKSKLQATGSVAQLKPGAASGRPDDRQFTLRGGSPHFKSDPVSGKPPVYSWSTNCVISSKYTLLTFLPLNLFEQFRNLANLYFLFVGIFQIVPQFSTTDGNPTMYQPLAFIVFVSACRAAKEDWDRHKADALRNGFKYPVLKGDKFEDIESGDIRVGNVVKVLQNNMVPADMLFLSSALKKGHCFIDKSNLNGETTLEVMNSMVQTRPLCGDEKGLSSINLTLTYEPPNKRFDSFLGTIQLQTADGQVEYGVDGKSLIMRETNLRNCDWIHGLVVYTGNDTKIQRSNLEGEKPKTKVSYIMRCVNTYLIYMLLLQSVLCLIGGILAGAFRGGFTSDMWFLQFDRAKHEAPNAVKTGVFAFFSWFILLSQMVPISLIVSSELVKFIQSVFIEQDIQLYSQRLNKTTKCNSSTIHEDLGLVDYVFSDKTGTLTQNKMEFRYLLMPLVGEFGSRETDIAKSVKTRQQQLADKLAGRPVSTSQVSWTQLVKPHLAPKDPAIDRANCCNSGWFSDNCWSSPPSESELASEDGAPASKNEFTEEERHALLQRLYGKPPAGESPEETKQRRAILRRYMVHMALSNTVKPYEDEGVMKFQAESAEELAMANFSRSCGFFKRQTNPTVLEVTEYDENLKEKTEKVIETYNHVATFGFTSKRARVTVIYQRVDGDKRCTVMMKGQDTVALPLIDLEGEDEDALLENLKNMSTNGLRTLVCGYADLDANWWAQRAAAYQDMISRDTTPASEGHPEKCAPECEKCAQHNFFEQVEKDAHLKLVGLIGLEDQLQLLVPECIQDLVLGGIKVWMITGDKLETAKNIGLATNLIDPDMIPSFSSGDIKECVNEFQRSRLIEITGAWASMAKNDEDIGKIFDIFDKNGNGTINTDDLIEILTSLRCNLTPEKLKSLIASEAHGTSDGTSLNREGFMTLMKSAQMSRFDAVKFDIQEGIKTYNAITNHDQYPVSVLIDRAAFQVLFPGKAGATPTAADLKSLGPNVTLKELNSLREMFFQIAGRSKSVVFARAEPAHKKRMVTEIQARVKGAITLAIGDGANDCDMILAAHIGVGIAGVEGTAATNSADYAIGTFRMLHSLIFVHGFYSYQRTAKLVNFIFYKASLVAIMMFLFGFFSAMSGQQFFADAPYQLYNVMYTALPIMVVAIFDKLLPAEFLQDNPTLYQRQKHTAFDPMIFSGWIFRAFLHAVVLYFIPYASFGLLNVSQSNGSADGIWYFATTVYYCTVMAPTLLILFDMSSITFLSWLSIACSIAALFIVTLIMNYMTSIVPDLDGVVTTMYDSAMFWLVLILSVGICLILELVWRAAMRELYPTVVQIYQEINRLTKEEQRAALDPAKLLPPASMLSSSSDGANGAAATSDNIEIEYSQSGVGRAPMRSGSFSRAGSVAAGIGGGHPDTSRSQTRLKNNMVRAMLRFRNMTGAQFDSAAQAELQQHDKFQSPNPTNTAPLLRGPSGSNATALGSNGAQSSPRYDLGSPSTSSASPRGNTQAAAVQQPSDALALLDKYSGPVAHHYAAEDAKLSATTPRGHSDEPMAHDRRL